MEMFYEGDAERLIDALLESHHLEKNPKHRLIVHDWSQHADYNTRRKVERRNGSMVANGNQRQAAEANGDQQRVMTHHESIPVPEPAPEPEPEPEPKNKDSLSSTLAPPTGEPTDPASPTQKKCKQTPPAEYTEVVQKVFDYYVEHLNRDPTRYTLTAERSKKAHARLKHCLKLANGNLNDALSMMCDAVDGLLANDWLMGRDPKTNGQRWIEFAEHVFRSDDQMEKRWEDYRKARRAS